MNVNVFVTRIEHQLQPQLLVLPLLPQAPMPPQYRTGWNYYATVDTRHRMFGDIDAVAMEHEITNSGFALVAAQMSNRE